MAHAVVEEEEDEEKVSEADLQSGEAFRKLPLRSLPRGLGFAGLAGSRAVVDSLRFLDLSEELPEYRALKSGGASASNSRPNGADQASKPSRVPSVAELLNAVDAAICSSQQAGPAPGPAAANVPPAPRTPKPPSAPPPPHVLARARANQQQQQQQQQQQYPPPWPPFGSAAPPRPEVAGPHSAAGRWVPAPPPPAPAAAGPRANVPRAAVPAAPVTGGQSPPPASTQPAGTQTPGAAFPGVWPPGAANVQNGQTMQPPFAAPRMPIAPTAPTAPVASAAAWSQHQQANAQLAAAYAAAVQQQQAVHAQAQQAQQAALGASLMAQQQPNNALLAGHAAVLQHRATNLQTMLNTQQQLAAQAQAALLQQQQQMQQHAAPSFAVGSGLASSPQRPSSTTAAAAAPQGTMPAAKAAVGTASGGLTADKALVAYAEQELKKFVSKLRLSKETEQALRSLDVEAMLGVMVEQKQDAGEPGEANQATNADGAEDVVVMARVRRARLEAPVTEPTPPTQPAPPLPPTASATSGVQPVASTGSTKSATAVDDAKAAVAKLVEEAAKVPKADKATADSKDGAAKGGNAAGNDTDEGTALLRRFVSENGLSIAVEKKLKDLSKKDLLLVMGQPDSTTFKVKGSFRDPTAEVERRIEIVLAPPALSKEATEIDAKIREKILKQRHSLQTEQEVVAFVNKHKLGKDVVRALLMLTTPQIQGLLGAKSLLVGCPAGKEDDAVITQLKKLDSKAYGLVKAFKAAQASQAVKAASADKPAAEDKPKAKKSPERKRSEERKKSPDKRKKSISPRKRSASNKKRKGREQHRKSKSLRRDRRIRKSRTRSVKRKSKSPHARQNRGRSEPRARQRKQRSESGDKRIKSLAPKKRSSSRIQKPAKSVSKETAKEAPKEAAKEKKEKIKTLTELREMARTAMPNYRVALTRLYKEVNPEKVTSVDQLMSKYAGQEAEMYERVCRKYGVEPTLDGESHKRPDGSENAAIVALAVEHDSDHILDDCETITVVAAASDDGSHQPSENCETIKAATATTADQDGGAVRHLTSAIDKDGAADEANHSAEQSTSEQAAVATDAVAIVPQSEEERPVWDWLKGLDNGNGALCRYFDVLRREFDADFSQIAAARLATPISPGAVGSIDPCFFEVLGVASAGHKLLLAKGIMAMP